VGPLEFCLFYGAGLRVVFFFPITLLRGRKHGIWNILIYN
jgi:hypothetical protein